MENLKIYGTDGKVILERDLGGEKGPLMVLAGDAPRLVDAVEQGAEILGALVRDEDGWVLASAKTDLPVASGSKRAQSSPLAAGVSRSGPGRFVSTRRSSPADRCCCGGSVRVLLRSSVSCRDETRSWPQTTVRFL